MTPRKQHLLSQRKSLVAVGAAFSPLMAGATWALVADGVGIDWRAGFAAGFLLALGGLAMLAGLIRHGAGHGPAVRKAQIRANRARRQRRDLAHTIQLPRRRGRARLALAVLIPAWLMLATLLLVLTGCTPQPVTAWSCTVVQDAEVHSYAGGLFPVIDQVTAGEAIIALGDPLGSWQQVSTPRLLEGYLPAGACLAQ